MKKLNSKFEIRKHFLRNKSKEIRSKVGLFLTSYLLPLKHVLGFGSWATKLSAFTLTEVIITLGLFSFIMASFSAIVSTVVQNSYVNDARVSLRQNLEFASDVVTRYLQNAQPQSILLFHGIANPNLKYCDVANDEICFSDRSLTSTGEPLYYKVKVVKEQVYIASQKQTVELGRIYLYQYRSAAELAQPAVAPQVVETRVLTYRDTNLDLAKTTVEIITPQSSPTQQASLNAPTVQVAIHLQADSTYFIRKDVPAARGMQKLVTVQVQ